MPQLPDRTGILHRLLKTSAQLYKSETDNSIDVEVKLGTYPRNFDNIESFLPFGSLDIDFGKKRAADDETREFEGSCMLRLRSDNNPRRSGAFASSSIRDMRVKVQFAGGGDVAQHYASFDLSEELEDRLHRPTEAMMHFPDPKSRGGIEAKLNIRTENRFGSQETAELTLKHVEGPLNIDRFSVFQARPFLYTAVSDIDLDPEGGSILARWRNDDDREWRMPYRSATLEMPAQSIGEEMERGSRFWAEEKDDDGRPTGRFLPYISESRPIDYRFSPTTRLTIEPDNGRRRYNSVPSNIFQITREAGVKSFQTEMVYPVAIGYQRGNHPTVQVMLSEAGAFMGETGPNLPFLRTRDEKTIDVAQQVFDGSLADWAVYHWRDHRWKESGWPGTIDAYRQLRLNNSAAKANYASRVAQLVLWDGNRPRDAFLLDEDLSFEIRSNQRKSAELEPTEELVTGIKNGGFPTPPLISPLPTNPVGADLTFSERTRIAAFLSGADWDEGGKGGVRGGVLHTIEFPSELFAILRNPKSRAGWIGNVSFSNLGITGQMEVAFDEGRTTFTAEVEHGQLSRLIRRRIGKIAGVWARCRHVTIYSRVTLPSPQFAEEQEGAEFPGWPLLRKIEEYIEPIDEMRVWNNETDAERNSTACFSEFEWVTKRIYVNSSWGEELDGPISGYKIPLWDGGVSEQDQRRKVDEAPGADADNVETAGWFYPKPKLSLNVREEDGKAIRHWCCDPDELYFYTNTEEGAGPDPDTWPPVPGVDTVEGVMRVGVLTKKPRKWDSFLGKRAKASPRRDSMRRKGFDLRVNPDAAVNLQAGRSEKPLFAKLQLVSLARTAEQSEPKEAFTEELAAKFDALQNSAELSGAIGDVTAPITSWIRELDERLGQFACKSSAKEALERELNALADEAKNHVRAAFDAIPADAPAPPSFEVVRQELEREISGLTLTSPATIEEFATSVREYIQREVRMPDDTDAALKEVQKDIQRRGKIIKDRIRSAAMTIKREIVDKGTLANADIALMTSAIDAATADITSLRTAINNSDDLARPIETARTALQEAETAARKVRKSPYVNVAKQALTLITGARRFLQTAEDLYTATREQVTNGLEVAVNQIAALESALVVVSAQITALSSFLVSEVDDYFKRLVHEDNDNPGVVNDLEALLDSIVEMTSDQTKEAIQQLALHLSAQVDAGEKSALAVLQSTNEAIRDELRVKLEILSLNLSKSYTELTVAYGKAVREFTKNLDSAASWFDTKIDTAVDAAKGLINQIDNNAMEFCEELRQKADEIRTKLEAVKSEIEDKIRNEIQDVFDEQTRRDFANMELEAKNRIEELRREYGPTIGQVDTGLKVVKAIGDMPALPDLTFNVDRAEYVFDDVRNQIATSPFGARVKEIESGLRELGVNIPVDGILDQLLPTSDAVNAKFNEVIKGIGGMDFEGLLEKLRLPEIKEEQYQVTHGIDEKTRTAWIKSRVNVDIPGRNALFEAGAFGLYMSKMSLRGSSDITMRLDGRRESITDGKLSADWGLRLGGTQIATFRDVTVHYDGSSLDFDIDPKKIEYHPSLRFVSDVAKRLEESVPPGVKLLKDERGRPYGAEARLDTVVKNPPPLGPITLGPLALNSGVMLTLANKGDFVIRSYAGVGSEERPIFVQIGWLGGGAWITASVVNKRDGKKRVTEPEGSIGVALGSMRSINIANVARGSYSFLLFANANFNSKGSVLRAGLSVRGSARLMAVATVYVHLLLVAIHSSRGGATGKGKLRAKVKISRFYTLRVSKSVSRKIN